MAPCAVCAASASGFLGSLFFLKNWLLESILKRYSAGTEGIYRLILEYKIRAIWPRYTITNPSFALKARSRSHLPNTNAARLFTLIPLSTMKKQFFLLALLFAVGGYSASAQTTPTTTTTTKETTVTPASTSGSMPTSTTPTNTTTTESTTTTTQPASSDAVVVPGDAKVKSNHKKTKIKPRD
jgi:hypothetical protein